jgi:hypothetical protein
MKVGGKVIVALTNDFVSGLVMRPLQTFGRVWRQHRDVAPKRDIQHPVNQDAQVPLKPRQC